jgi:hypothetical protein
MGRLIPACDSVERLSLGAYVLGALDPVERAHVEAHLAACPACRDELAELAGLPGLLSRIDPDDVAGRAPAAARAPAPGLADRLVERLRAARRARRRRVGAFAAGALAVALVGIAIALATTDDSTAPAGRPAVTAATGPGGVRATMALQPAAWGTAVRVSLRGVPAGTRCRLVAVSRGGRREVAGTWRADYEGHADVTTATAIQQSDLASLDVVAGGRRLVRVPVG